MTDEHTFGGFDTALEALRGDVLTMGRLSAEALDAAVQAVFKRDADLAGRVIDEDERIDDLHARVNDNVVHALTEHNALAADLREILVAGRMAAELERIGDHAKSIGKRARILGGPLDSPLLFQIRRLHGKARPLLDGVMAAYGRRDDRQARRLWVSDAELDDIYRSFFHDLIGQLETGSSDAASATHLLFIAKSIERIGDHATNIAEEVSFLVTGVPVTNPRPKTDTLGPE